MPAEPVPARLSWLNHNKLYRPPLGPSIERPRLLRRLELLSSSRLALLRAEAGYGKTTLIADFLRAYPHPAIWYRLDRGDHDVAQFVAYLTQAIAYRVPDFGAEIRERLAGGGRSEQTQWLPQLLLHEISELPPSPLLLVLDNFEAVSGSAEVCDLVSDLLEYSGPETRFLIASRTLPPLRLARLEAQQRVVTIGAGELALTVDESRRVLELHEARVPDEPLRVVWERTEGWPAGLAMVAAALRQKPVEEVIASLQGLQGSLDLLYRYFADEVFQAQSPELQQFLLKTSILSRLSSELVNGYLQIDNAGDLLTDLSTGGGFVHMEQKDGELRYHPLFRAFLLQKLHRSRGAESIRRLHREAARAAARCDCWGDAIDLYATAEDWEQVGNLIEQHGEDLIQRGFTQTVQQWLDLVPQEQVLSRPVLMMLRGRLLHRAGRHHEALQDLERSLRGFQEGGNLAGSVLAQLEIALGHYWVGEFRRAEAVLSEALRQAGDDAALRSRVLAQLSGTYVASDNLQSGTRWAELAAAESALALSSAGNAISLSRALRFRGRALALQGQLHEGLRDVQRSVELCRQNGIGDIDLAWSLFELGQVLALQGSLDDAARTLAEAETLAGASRQLLGTLWNWRGNVHRDAGEFAAAESAYRRSGIAPAVREMAFLRVRQGRVAEAVHHAGEALRSCERDEHPARLASCQTVYGISLAAAGEARSGLRHLKMAERTFERRGRMHQLASLRWHLARWLLDEGRRPEAMERLREAVSWGARQGIYQMWWWDPETVARLWPLAFNAGWERQYLLELARRRLGRKEYSFLYGALDSAPPPLRGELMETLRVISGDVNVVQEVAEDLLNSCHDRSIRQRLGEALALGDLAPNHVRVLRREAGLTWREIEVLLLYYLRPQGNPADGARHHLAEELGLSEQTLKVHIRSIRRKLDLRGKRRSAWSSLPAMIDHLQAA